MFKGVSVFDSDCSTCGGLDRRPAHSVLETQSAAEGTDAKRPCKGLPTMAGKHLAK